MNLQEFIRDIADVEGKEALQEFSTAFWKQASDEDKKTVVLAIDRLHGHLRKVVKSFWELCGVHIADGWITVDGKSYAISAEVKADTVRASVLYNGVQSTHPDLGRVNKVVLTNDYYKKPEDK